MAEIKKYTFAEVKTRNGRGKNPVWIVYKDSIYDVTSYIPEHPAGDVILEEAGQDATKAFDDSGHSKSTYKMLEQYKIGEIVDAERKYDANGKKIKRVIEAKPEEGNRKSCMNIITCGLLG
ncbi:hypothetical protein KGM_204630 [Danaus plexippus plexippus]|uniref:Uncharacterized protein n=1 Tax=Danaus plexippus plexippus TaxID=278856 RepID=A0A212FP33_DANPL|nr:hypothetical protein KGM_204630 [Danaus plexippus plexippus]